MIVRSALFGAALLGLVAVAGPAPEARSGTPAAAYSIDSTHSSLVFRVMHNNAAPFYGRIDRMSGTVNIDDSNLSASTLEVEVQTDTVNSGNGKRNDHIKSKDFFDVAKFPTASFKGTSFAKNGEDAYDVTGDFTLHGVTKPVTIKLVKTGAVKTQRGELVGYETTLDFKRSDYGISHMTEALGDDIRLIIGIEAGKR
jgi:polyisoprenoid-binding protein YceI